VKVQLIFVERRRLHFLDEHRPSRQDRLGGLPADHACGFLALIPRNDGFWPPVSKHLFWNDCEPKLRSGFLFAQVLAQRVAINVHSLENGLVTVLRSDSSTQEVAVDRDEGERLHWPGDAKDGLEAGPHGLVLLSAALGGRDGRR
jgi:hypothetical protein